MNPKFLAVDLGQGSCRVARPGTLGSVFESEGFRSDRDPFELIATAVLAVVDSASDLRIGIGMTGLNGAAPRPSRLLERLTEARIRGEVVVADDSVTAYLGALGPVSGAVVSAGTGAVALGVNLAGGIARSDGWGYLMGDRGSGYWIGIEAVRAAMRSYDRGRPGALFDLVERTWGDPTTLAGRWRESPQPPEAIASLAPEVAAIARAGDQDAMAIWARAGELLADSVTDVIQGAGLATEDVPVAAVGGLMGSADVVADVFAASIRRECPHAVVVTAAGNALDGSMLLATSTTLHPTLEKLITRAFITEKIGKK
jgi:glucosamine kinase